MKRILVVLLSVVSLPSPITAFVAPSATWSPVVVSSGLSAKKSRSAGQGFGKSSPAPTQLDDESDITSSASGASSRALKSIIDDGDISPPSAMANANSIDLDPSLSPEQRSQAILRQKFGLKSFEEQRAMEGDARALVEAEAKRSKREKLRNLDKIWPEDKDLFEVLPPELLRGIDTSLKVGLGVCTTLFIVAGVLITIEAGSKATGYELPDGLEDWVVSVVEPNFTPLLGVLLGFSVGLGLFSAGQLGSRGSVYREDP
ncbi:hypothetical protein ACHAW6_011625 [Cyclotella cf. meneghiniana]